MNNILDVMVFLEKHAPDMKVGPAMEIARRVQGLHDDMMIDARALALVATDAGLGDNGQIPENPDRRPADQWAWKRAQYRHGWIVCGPHSGNGMERLEINAGRLQKP